MSQQDLSINKPSQPINTSYFNLPPPEWYRSHVPHSKTTISDYWTGFNVSAADFKKLKDDITSHPLNLDLQGLKSRDEQLRWQNWASEFCKTRFVVTDDDDGNDDRPPLEWLIQAVVWLRKTYEVNTRKRKRAMSGGISLSGLISAGSSSRESSSMVSRSRESRSTASASRETTSTELGILEISRPNLMWVAASPIPSTSQTSTDMDIEKNLVVKFPKTTNELQDDLPWFNTTDLDNFSNSLGPAFINSTQPSERPDIHQGLVTMQILKHAFNAKISVSVHSWNDFYKEFIAASELETMQSMLLDSNQTPVETIILLYVDASLSSESGVDSLYTRLERLRSCFGARVRAIPRWTESLRARMKVRDIKALDEHALKAGYWRPITCFPGMKCYLEDEEVTVHKRQESSGGECVQVRKRGEHGELTCQRDTIEVIQRDTRSGEGTQNDNTKDTRSKSKKKNTQQLSSKNKTKSTSSTGKGRGPADIKPLWFHQQFVPTFTSHGEFRVFITTKPHSQSRRGLRGTITAIAHTIDSLTDAETMYVEAATESTFKNMNCGLSLLQLKTFALEVFDNLRARDDWEETFESLEVGVRLDVGVSPPWKGYQEEEEGEEEEQRQSRGFFVNEITRWYNAAFFSDDIMTEPKYTLCEEFAGALGRYLGRIK